MDIDELVRNTWQTAAVFTALLVFTRILGKTQVGQLTFYEYVSGITIGSIAGNIIASEPEEFLMHSYDLTLFVVMAFAISHITLISRPLRKIIEGTPTVVIKDGEILRDNMRGMRYDLDELTSQLREKGILDVSEVQYAIIENNGAMSVIQKPNYQPVTKSDLQLKNTSPAKYPVELVMDGEVIEENLSQHYTRAWLMQQLQTKGCSQPSDAMYAVVDSKGKLFVCKKTQ